MKRPGTFLRFSILLAAVPLSRCNCAVGNEQLAPKDLRAPQIDVCGPDADGDEVCYESLKKDGGPAPTLVVDFGSVAAGATKSVTVTVKNNGTGELGVRTPKNEDISGSAMIRFSSADRSNFDGDVFMYVASMGEESFTMQLVGNQCGPHETTYRLYSNDNIPGHEPYIPEAEGADNPIVITFRGRVTGPCLCALPPTFLDYGSVPVGQQPIKRFTFESCGDSPLVVSDTHIADDIADVYSIANTAIPGGGTMLPGEQGQVDVRYAPAFESPPGDYDLAKLRIETNAPTAPSYPVPLIGRGVPKPSCKLRFLPAQASFGVVDDASTRNFRLWNDGKISCRVYDVARTSGSTDFVVAGGAPPPEFTLLPNESREIQITYAPNDDSADQAVFTATGDDIDGYVSQAVLSVSGNPAVPSEGCVLQIQPDFGDFGEVTVGASVPLVFELENVGDGDFLNGRCQISSVSLPQGAPDYRLGDLSFFSYFLMPGLSTSITVYFEPESEGVKAGILRFHTNDVVSSVRDVPLWGRALGAQLCVDVPGADPVNNEQCGPTQPCATLDFGTASSQVTRNITLRNCGAGTLELRGISPDPTNGLIFWRSPQSPEMPTTLAPNETTTMSVRYIPTGEPGDFGGFTILSNAGTAPMARLNMRGNYPGDCERIIRCFPGDSLEFGSQEIETTNVRTVSCTNYGIENLTVSNAGVSGNSSFDIVSSTFGTLAPGEAFLTQVSCTPMTSGEKNGSLRITSDSCDVSPYDVALSCRGVIPVLEECRGSDTFLPEEKWRWTGTDARPEYAEYDDVWNTPIVVQLDDDNEDGVVDILDTPDVVFTALDSEMEATGEASAPEDIAGVNDPKPAIAVAVSGDTGAELWTFGRLPTHDGDPDALAFECESSIAAADIDGDGRVEIVGMKYTYVPEKECPENDMTCMLEGKYAVGSLIAIEHDGTYKWESETFHFPEKYIENASAPSIGDMNGDGIPEISIGNAVFDANGLRLFEGNTRTTTDPGHGEGGAGSGSISIFVDLSGDGVNELLAGTTAFNYDGTVRWDRANDLGDGIPVIGNFDGDIQPEILILNGANDLYVLEHDGNVKFGPFHVVSGNVDSETGEAKGFLSTAPALGDLDGDGMVEVVIAATNSIHIFEHDLTWKWSAPIDDQSGASGPTTFDFEGDGRAEVVHADESDVWVWNGSDGALKYQAPRNSRTIWDNPVIADIDNDNHADIILAMETPSNILGSMHGVIAYSNKGNDWVGTRRVWNQHAYHITNISEAGVVPAFEGPGWMEHNLYRSNTVRCVMP